MTAVTAMTSLALATEAVTLGGTGEAVTFWLLAPLSVICAVAMLLVRKGVHSALLLAVVMVCLAVLYVVQEAPFLGVVQVVVYTGAVMMLFLFVLMLVGVDSSDSVVETLRGHRWAAILVTIGFAALLSTGLARVTLTSAAGLGEANADGNVPGLATLIFSKYLFPFEVTSALLITAAMGAMVLAHRERHDARPTQRQLSEARFRDPLNAVSLPAPGVYARHNAVDTPALLPDKSPAPDSVPRSIMVRGAGRRATPYVEDANQLEDASQLEERRSR